MAFSTSLLSFGLASNYKAQGVLSTGLSERSHGHPKCLFIENVYDTPFKLKLLGLTSQAEFFCTQIYISSPPSLSSSKSISVRLVDSKKIEKERNFSF